MSDNTRILVKKMSVLDLSSDESAVFLELVKGPHTHLQLSRVTGINRTKVYRLVEQLEQRSLVVRHSDDKGTFLMASDLEILESEILAVEEKAHQQRLALQQLKPALQSIAENGESFVTRTYSGVQGFKQMLWHELKTKDELLLLGNVLLEDLVDSRQWSEKLRALTAEAGFKLREIINVPYEQPRFTDDTEYMRLYSSRCVDVETLPVGTPITIFNDTVNIYDVHDNRRAGIEIISPTFANTMRHIFEYYWEHGTA